MGRGVIDGDRWIGQRLAFLRDLLKSDLTDEQRKAVEEEIGRLSNERGIHIGGRRRWWVPSRWIGRHSRPDSPVSTDSADATDATPAGPAGPADASNQPTDQPQPSSSNRESEIPK